MKNISVDDLEPIVTKVEALSDIMHRFLYELSDHYPDVCFDLGSEISRLDDLKEWLAEVKSK